MFRNISFSGSLTSEAEERLYHHLFKIYNPLIRPVQNITETITIEFNLALSQIISVVSTTGCTYRIELNCDKRLR